MKIAFKSCDLLWIANHKTQNKMKKHQPAVLAFAGSIPLVIFAAETRGATEYDTVGVYDENSASSNGVDINAPQAAAFASVMASAYAEGNGGVIDFEGATSVVGTTHSAVFGPTDDVTMNFSTDYSMLMFTSNSTEPISKLNAFGPSTNRTAWTLTVGDIIRTAGGQASPLRISRAGMTILSRNNPDYPLDARVTVAFSDATSEVVTIPLSDVKGGGDTFLSVSAPPGTGIMSLTFASFQTGTSIAVSNRIAIDDLGVCFEDGGPLQAPEGVVFNDNMFVGPSSDGSQLQIDNQNGEVVVASSDLVLMTVGETGRSGSLVVRHSDRPNDSAFRLEIPASGPSVFEIDGRPLTTLGTSSYPSSFLTGSSPAATGNYAFVAGSSNTAARGSAVFGENNVVSGQYAMSFGVSSSATDSHSFGGGLRAHATGRSSFAFGEDVEATGAHSISMGEDTAARNVGSVAFGKGTETDSRYALVAGDYNENVKSDGSNPGAYESIHDPILEIGNGSSGGRRNALTTFRDGRTVLKHLDYPNLGEGDVALEVRGDAEVSGDLNVAGSITVAPAGDLKMGEFN